MASFDYRLNPLYPIKECSSCGALYTMDYCCSDGSLEDKIICDLNKTPDLSQRPPQNCPKCGNPIDGHYCQGCALLRKKFKEDLFTYCIENGILQDSSERSNNNTNVVNALQEPFVVKQDLGKASSQSSPQINHHCCYRCCDSLEDIFFHQCTCELCGKGAHYGYNFLPKVPIIPDPEPFNNQTIDELPQTLLSFDPTYYSEDGNSFTYDSISNLDHDSPNFFGPPLQSPLYLCKFYENDARYGHYCTPQVPFIYPKPCYNQDIYFPQSFHDFQQQYLCFENYGGPHEAYQFTPILSIEDPNNSLSMRDEHLDTISAMKSEEFIKSSVESLVSIPNQFEDFFDSNDDSTSIDDYSFFIDNIEYVEASPPDYELVSSEISSGSTTTRSDVSLPDYEAFYDDHVKEISSGSATTHSNSSLYDSFIFDLSINPFSLADRSDFYEFIDELTHIISPPEYDCFCFKNEPNAGDFIMDVVEDIFPIREPRVHNVLPTHPNRQLNLDFILSSESLFTYVVWMFLPFLSYSVAPQYLLTFKNEDTIFDPGISSYHISSFMPDVSHRSGTFMKINVHPKHLNEIPMEILFSTCSPKDQ
nr:hypothetical protein [Tanacetum cinerariifolium]